jgi:ATP-dependent Lon protease
MPRENEKDLPDIPDAIKKTMKLHFVESMDEVLKIALERETVALPIPPVDVAHPGEETVAH